MSCIRTYESIQSRVFFVIVPVRGMSCIFNELYFKFDVFVIVPVRGMSCIEAKRRDGLKKMRVIVPVRGMSCIARLDDARLNVGRYRPREGYELHPGRPQYKVGVVVPLSSP